MVFFHIFWSLQQDLQGYLNFLVSGLYKMPWKIRPIWTEINRRAADTEDFIDFNEYKNAQVMHQ